MSASGSDSGDLSPWDEEAYQRDPEGFKKKEYERSAKKDNKKPYDPLLSFPSITSYEEKYLTCPPHLEQSISLTAPDCWTLGSLMICEKLEVQEKDDKELSSISKLSLSPGSGIVYQWEDSGSAYCLRKRSLPKTDRTVEGDPEATRIQASLESGVWNLSPNVFCKTLWWCEDSTTDAETIKFINKNIPSVPTEELMYDWIDPEWCRSFMLTRRVPGKTFEEAWPLLTTEHRLQIADQIAVHMKALSAFTSDHLETVTGKGIEGIHSLRLRVDLPLSVPRVEPPVSKEDYRKYLEKKYKQTDIPDSGEYFVLQHPDLNPTNYFVAVPSNPDEAAKLTAIIDWNRVGYYPAFNLTLYHRALSIYAVGGSREGADWMWMLSNALYKVGFPLEMEFLRRIWPVWGIQEKNLPEGIPKSTRGTMPQA